MKSKLVLTSLLSLILLSGCGAKENTNQDGKMEKNEKTENTSKQTYDKEKALEDEKFESEEYPVKVESYVKSQKNDYGATVSTEKDGKDGEYVRQEIKLAKGKVVEFIGSEGGSEYIDSYSIEVTDSKDKTNGEVTNGELGLSLASDFLQDAKLIDKPLNSLFDIDVNKREDYDLDDTHTLTLDPQDNGYTIIISRSKSVD